MTVNYPNGKPYSQDSRLALNKKNKPIYGKRGMGLEEELNQSNQYYLMTGKAVIHKKPTPIQVVKVNYPRRSAATITEAYYRQSSTTDFNGVYKGHYIDFEAKETRNKTSFPLKNFHAHQIEHMKACLQQRGICFVIMAFTTLHRTFLFESRHLIAFWEEAAASGRKSIPLTAVETSGIEILPGFQPPLDYLQAVDVVLQRHNHSTF